MSKKIPSPLWYIVPVLFGIIGGIVSYFILKDKSKKMAKNLLYIGIIVTVIYYVLPMRMW